MRKNTGRGFPAPSAPAMPDQVSFDIERDLTAPTSARRAVEAFGAELDPAVLPDVRLLVSELISNSVKYGGEGQLQLILRSEDPRHVHVEVVDQGVGFVPTARNRPKTEPGGWGLHMVEALTERWGVREGSTHVWFEIDRR
jgi:anti-sigma regulatory factor (Ser/Thr protein kinase)